MSTESPFVTVNRVLSERPNAFDDLRIIATGDSKLDTPKREIIAAAADELEAAQRLLVTVQLSLIETQQKLIAVNDQLIEARKAAISPPAGLRLSMSSGWIRTEYVK